MSADHEVSQLLGEWANGDPKALERLVPLVYTELRHLAAAYLRREKDNVTLQPTALVHEAYLRLAGQQNTSWQNRSHFYGVAAHLMRQILVDHARRRRAGKRAACEVSLEETISFAPERGADVLALEDALNVLEKLDPRKCKVVELRYFGGLSMEETAQSLAVSPGTVRRDLRMAEAWLYREMRGASCSGGR